MNHQHLATSWLLLQGLQRGVSPLLGRPAPAPPGLGVCHPAVLPPPARRRHGVGGGARADERVRARRRGKGCRRGWLNSYSSKLLDHQFSTYVLPMFLLDGSVATPAVSLLLPCPQAVPTPWQQPCTASALLTAYSFACIPSNLASRRSRSKVLMVLRLPAASSVPPVTCAALAKAPWGDPASFGSCPARHLGYPRR